MPTSKEGKEEGKRYWWYYHGSDRRAEGGRGEKYNRWDRGEASVGGRGGVENMDGI